MVFLPCMFGYMFYFGEQSGFVYTESLKLLVLLYLFAFFCASLKPVIPIFLGYLKSATYRV